jgi:hypothetical protein
MKGVDDGGRDLRIFLGLEQLEERLNRVPCTGADPSEAGGRVNPDELVLIVKGGVDEVGNGGLGVFPDQTEAASPDFTPAWRPLSSMIGRG